MYESLSQKKEALDKQRPLPDALVRNLEEWFHIELTYTSNAIEGNTLTRRETALVVEKGITVGGKSLAEHIEATNHAAALTWVKEQVKKKPQALVEKDILHIHEVILKGLDDAHAGYYRSVPVRISGSDVILPNPRKVPELMLQFVEWIQASHKLHPVEFAAEAHYQLVTIHPFVDGNGRTARLLMNMILLMGGYPPAIIRKRDRLAYISSLENAQTGGSKDNFLKIIRQAVNRSLDIYLKALDGDTVIDEAAESNLMTIGKLAKAVNETAPTIRHWTQKGLLMVAQKTASGYQLYSHDMVQRVQQIQALKQQRFTLDEIKKKLGK